MPCQILIRSVKKQKPEFMLRPSKLTELARPLRWVREGFALGSPHDLHDLQDAATARGLY